MNSEVQKMTTNSLSKIRAFFSVSVPDQHRADFDQSINQINFSRAKLTALAFILMEIIVLISSFLAKNIFKTFNLYYMVMYLFMLVVMAMFLFRFYRFDKKPPRNSRQIRMTGTVFTGFILAWCAGISLLDYISSDQVMVYVFAVIAVAATPLFEPATIFILYAVIHIIFLTMLFMTSGTLPFGVTLNSTAFVLISCCIVFMRYQKQVKQFNDKKIIEEKSKELKRINMELEKANRKLEKLSQTDSLTGIYNRFMFDRMIESEWDRCKRQFKPLTFLMIDIDFFKTYNDYFGHQAGDNCLRRVAGVLISCAKRSSDTVARYGGEEFAIILPYMERENAAVLADQIRERVEKLAIYHPYSTISKYVTICIGVNTVLPANGGSIEEFIRKADGALYEVKKSRNAIAVA